METKRKMQLVMQMGSGYGLDQGAWRMPNAVADVYTNLDVQVELAKLRSVEKYKCFSLLTHQL